MENSKMNKDLLVDLWNLMSDHIPEKEKADVSQEFVTTLLDYNIVESTLKGMVGVDTYLDTAIEYALDEDDEEDWDE